MNAPRLSFAFLCLLAGPAVRAGSPASERSFKPELEPLGFSAEYPPAFGWTVRGADEIAGAARAEVHVVLQRGNEAVSESLVQPFPAEPKALLEQLVESSKEKLAELRLGDDPGTELYRSGTATQGSFTVAGKEYQVRLRLRRAAPNQAAELTVRQPGGVPTIVALWKGGWAYSLHSIRLSRDGARIAVVCKRSKPVSGGMEREHLVALAFLSDAAAPGGERQEERDPGLPRFSQFPAAERCSGRPAPVDLDSDPDARRFKTRLREGASKGPNFAGCYTYVEWGCGTGCQSFVIIDARDGRVHSPQESLSLSGWYEKGSALFVANPVEGVDQPPSEVTTFYRWDGSGLVPMVRSTVPLERKQLR